MSSSPSASGSAVIAGPNAPRRPHRWRRYGALLLVLFVKAKVLFLPLLKIIPLLVSIWVYGLFFGYPFAVLFAALIAVHELGHYAVMVRLGIQPSFPMFIPGLGAMIFTRRLGTLSLSQQAIIGYAGPLTGTLGAIVFATYGLADRQWVWVAAAYSGFFLNAFNLLPVPPFDGSHIARLASDKIWVLGLAVFAALSWYFPGMRNPFVLVIVVMSLPRVFSAWSSHRTEQRRAIGIGPRLLFALAYFVLIGIDLAGMLATHYTYS